MRASLAILSLLLLSFTASAAAFDAERVHLIDSIGHNFLFRTGDPTVPANPGPLAFSYADLDAAFRSVAAASNLTLPSKYYLVDICLLSYELVEINTEVQFFKDNASVGEFRWWPTVGTFVNAEKVPPLLRKEMAIAWEGNYTADHLPERVATLRANLETQTAIPTVYMIHCTVRAPPPSSALCPYASSTHCLTSGGNWSRHRGSGPSIDLSLTLLLLQAGEDRTGELSGAYYITYKNMSFAAALTLDDSINPDENGRSISCLARNGFQWYCLHLLYTGAYNLDECVVPPALPQCSYNV